MSKELVKKGLKWLLGRALEGVAGDVFDKGLHLILGGEDTEKILDELHQVMEELKQVKEAVHELSKQLNDGLLQIRKDAVIHDLSQIETLFKEVNACIVIALGYEKNKPAEKDVIEIESRLERHLKDCMDKIPTTLDQVHSSLGAEGAEDFPRHSAKVAHDNSNDFITYYWQMNTQVSGSSAI